MNELRINLLGPVTIQQNNQTVDFHIGKIQALIAYLAVTGQPQTREHLIDLLWNESSPEAARKNLRNGLWRLRQQVDNDLITAEGERLCLVRTAWIDVIAFETSLSKLAQPGPFDRDEYGSTLNLWRGPLLDGLRVSDAPDFELWLGGERERLARAYLTGLRAILASVQATAQWNTVIDIAQRALTVDESDEMMHVAMMEALAQLGRRSEALRQYDTLRSILDRTLSMQPQADTKARREQILSGQFPTPEARRLNTRNETTNLRRPIARPRRPFVGREAECETLNNALRAAMDNVQIVLLSGELGIGKSTLWQQWSATQNLADNLSAATILETRCLASTQALPLAPLTDLFGKQVLLKAIAGSESTVSPVWLTELSRVLPQIGEIRPDLPPAVAVPPDEERRRLYEACIQAVRALPAPRILFVDDLHWADMATLDWLAYLTERLNDESLLLVGAYRVEEAQPLLSQVIGQWNRDMAVVHLPLAPLSHHEASSLLAKLDGDVTMVDDLHRQSGGNPYYLTELSRVHLDGMPSALVDLVRARLHSLPEDAQRLLQTAAIVEPRSSFKLLQAAIRWDEERTVDALDILLANSILIEQEVEQDSAYGFVHPMVADIVRDSMSTPRRQFLHRQAAELLQAQGEDATSTNAGQLAHHFAEAGMPQEAARFADQAADRAVQIGAMLEAVNFLRQSVALDPTPDRRTALGYALVHVPNSMVEARDVLQQALADAENEQDHKAMVQVGLRLAFSYLAAEEGEQVLQWAERLHVAAVGNPDIELSATIEYLMAAGKFNTPHLMAEAEQHYRAATQLVSEHDLNTEIAIQSWFGWGNLAVQQGDYGRAQTYFGRTLMLAQSSHNIYFEALCYNNLGYATLLAGDLEGARKTVESGLSLVETNQLLRPRQYLFSTRGEVALAEHELTAASTWFKRAIQEAKTYDNETHAANVHAHLGRVAWANGNLDSAVEQLNAAYQTITASGVVHLQIQIELWLAELHLDRNESSLAEEWLSIARRKLADSERQALRKREQQIRHRLKEASLS